MNNSIDSICSNIWCQFTFTICRSIAELKIGVVDDDWVLLMHIIADCNSAKHNLHLISAIVSRQEEGFF